LPSLVIYIGLALQQLYRHGRQRAEWRSDDLAISLDWVHAALVAFIALALMDIGREVIGFTSQAIPDDLALAVIIVAVVALLTLMTRAARSHDDKRGALPDIALTAPRPPADEDETRAAIRATWERSGELLCPHSAVGVHVAEAHRHPGVPMITLATAHPAKFPAAVEEASGIHAPLPERMADLYDRAERVTRVGNDLRAIETLIKERIAN
jgi:hypothetical protein